MEIEGQVESRPAPASDRRLTPRFAVDAEAMLFLVGHGLSVNCRVLDLSLKGCRVHTGGEIPAGIHVLVEITFSVNRIPFRLPGVIRRSNGEDEVGIEFSAMSGRRMAEWAEVVNEVESTLALKAEQEAAKAAERAQLCPDEADPAAESAA